MKVTYPHMGNAFIPINALLKGLKLEVVTPPPITKRTMELGTKYSPEFACLPLKINVGNFIEALEQGADTIVMAGGWGPCRFGYYAQVERDILQDLGYEFNLVILEAPDFKLSQLINQIRELGQNVTLWEALKVLKDAWRKLNAVESVERALEYNLPRTDLKNQAENIYEHSLKAIDKADNIRTAESIAAAAVAELQSLPCHDRRVMKIGLVGEIYTILEAAANYNICRTLGRLEGEVTRSIYLSEWVNDHLLGGIIKKSHHKEIINCAYPYLGYWVGGHGQETVGSTVDFARRNYDGVIQIGPLTCMPEIVAQSILPSVSDKEKIPCMTMWFDEHSGQAGVNTRLEAFMDMIRRQKTLNGALDKEA
ncbi:MAG TPA: CoA protein activase [Syntrophomonadaceae bacterium]|nr:CoA protein activase [Syntrophomonadaceae bacterium]